MNHITDTTTEVHTDLIQILSPDAGNSTCETCQTCISPSNNREFLTEVFGDTSKQHPFVFGFAGIPKLQKGWGGNPLTPSVLTDDPGRNWYYTLALYEGAHRREKECVAVRGIMLDDIGTKAAGLERLAACPPSIVIETSPGNYQATYLFTEPQTDLKAVAALNQATVDAGLCDAGAKSPATRWGRLPFAVNGKSDPATPCRLVEWHPQRRYTIEQIMDGLELAYPTAPEPKKRGRPAGGSVAPDPARLSAAIDQRELGEDVHIPRADENPVISGLKQLGLYKRPLGSGKHDVTCPWVHEHTDQIDGGSAYFEPSATFPIGGYKCQHSHGDTKRMGALLAFLGLRAKEAKHKSTIRVLAGELHRIVDTAERELSGLSRYYQRGGLIVSVNTDTETQATSNQASHTEWLAACPGLRWPTGSGSTDAWNDWVTSDPPTRHVNVLHDAETYQHLPSLAGLTRQAYLRDDGSVVRSSGYDTQTRMFGVFDERDFNVSTTPSHADAQAALTELWGLLDEFAFASDADKSAALAAMLTAAIRQSLPLAPMILIRAPQFGSGKSYLSALIASFGSPDAPSAVGFPTNEEECLKLLVATLLEAPATVMFDNLTSDLIPFKSLCSALTETHITGRILGVSKTATVPTRTLFVASGNNVEAVRDMTRRTLTITLDPMVADPATRTFEHDPVGQVRTDRGRFVSLALTVIRAWIVAGCPVTQCKPLNSFAEWTAWVRQPLMWLGLPDPATRVFETMAHDPDREVLDRLLHAWRAIFGKTPTMVRKAAERAEQVGSFGNDATAAELAEVMREIAEERGVINRRRFGKWIARHAGQIASGMRFEKAPGKAGAEQWQVVDVEAGKKQVTQVSQVQFPLNLLKHAELTRTRSRPPASGFEHEPG
jgi:hypothetical protein